MPTLHIYGIDHSRISPEHREALRLSASEHNALLLDVAVPELMRFSTCARTEVYLVSDEGPPVNPLEPWARELDSRCLRYHHQNGKAAAHLFAVASALRSGMPGDTQIAGQLVRAAGTARLAGTLGPMLEHLVAAALRCAKRVRRETGLAAGDAGTGPAVLRAIRRLAPLTSWRPKPVRVLLLGAGAAAEEIAVHLLRSGSSSQPITIAGVWAPDKRQATRFAAKFEMPCWSARQAANLLHNIDAVVGACRGRVALLSERVLSPVLAARPNPLLVIDLGVPRNLDPALAQRDGLNVIVLDQLHWHSEGRARIRQEALAQAERIVESESLRFEKWWAQWPLRPIRADVYASLEIVLSRWRSAQPGAVRHLRVALHRTLEQAFRSANQ